MSKMFKGCFSLASLAFTIVLNYLRQTFSQSNGNQQVTPALKVAALRLR